MTTASAPNYDGMILLEAPFARVPHDELRRYLRMQQRFVERDLTYCSTSLDSLAKSARSASSSKINTSTSPNLLEAPSANSATSGTISRSSEDAGDTSIADNSLLADVSFSSELRADDSLLSAITTVNENGTSDNTESQESIGKKSGSELERSLDQMIGRIKGLKRKLASVHESAGSTLTRLDARTGHLNELHQIESTSSPAFDEWCRTRLDRMLVDWMLRKGFTQSADMLAKSRKIENFVDLNLFAEIARIESSLVGLRTKNAENIEGGVGEQQAAELVTRSCTASLAWCSENKAALRKIRSTLEFDLRLQEFIELTRARTPQSLQDAISYSRKHLLSYLTISSTNLNGKSEGNGDENAKSKAEEKEEKEEQEQQESMKKQVARAMGLLACGPGGWAYQDLYDVSRWKTLQTKFRAAALQIHSLPPQPLLHIALSAGLSSLKLPACYTDDPSRSAVPPAHLGGRAFGDERSNLLSVAGVTSTSISAPPIFPPAAGFLQEFNATPSVVLSPPSQNTSSDAGSTMQSNHPPQSPQQQQQQQQQQHAAGNGKDDHSNPTTKTTLPLHCKNDDCPVCDSKGLGVLAKEVPWSHHINSTLVCAISGRIMDENDPPMTLPNGRVYSTSALHEMAAASQDGLTILCPRTLTSFPLSSLRKVYIS